MIPKLAIYFLKSIVVAGAVAYLTVMGMKWFGLLR